MPTNQAALNRVLTSASRKALTRRALEVQEVANANPDLPVKVRFTIEGTDYKNLSARVGSNDPLVAYEEGGTRPHTIRPRNGKALVFPGTNGFSGTLVFSKVVHHPGTAGKHVLRNALRKVIGRTG